MSKRSRTSSATAHDSPQAVPQSTNTVIPAKAGISDDENPMSAQRLLELYDRVADAPDAVERLRKFVLDLAVRGKLVEQDPEDEPASQVVRRARSEKARLLKLGKLPKKDAKLHNMIEPPFPIPASWEWAALGDLFQYDAGTKRQPAELDNAMWLLELEDIEKETGRLLQKMRVADRQPKSAKSEFQTGDVLYGKLRPYLTKVLVAERGGYSTTEIVAIRPIVPVCPEYGALALRRPDFVDRVTRLGRGTKMPRLRTLDAVVSPFPLPPLAEQQRIVAKVNDLMALLDRLETTRTRRETTRNRLTTASLTRLTAPETTEAAFPAQARFALDNLEQLTGRPEQIKVLRQAILNLAVRGKLVEQDPGDESASNLLEKIALKKAQIVREGKFKTLDGNLDRNPDSFAFTIPQNWSWCYLDDIAAVARGGSPRPIKAFLTDDTDGIPWIKIGDSRRGSIFIEETKERISADGLAKSRLVVRGDLLLSNSMSFGFPYITHIEGCIHDGWLVIRTPEGLVNKLYLHKVFLSDLAKNTFSEAASGAVVQNLNADKARQLSVPLPPLAEQNRIVKKVDTLTELCEKLETTTATGGTTRARLLEILLYDSLAKDAHNRTVA